LAGEQFEQLADALVGHRQPRRCQALHPIPVGDGDIGASAEPTLRPHGDLGDDPVPGAGLLDAEVDHVDVDSGQLGQIGIIDTDAGFDHFAEHQHLVGPLGEAAKRDIARRKCDGARFDGGNPQNRNENSSAREQFDNEAEHARLVAGDTDADHHIADTADGLAVGAQHHHPRESGRIDPVHRCHVCRE
jgi:hypothetical protein